MLTVKAFEGISVIRRGKRHRNPSLSLSLSSSRTGFPVSMEEVRAENDAHHPPALVYGREPDDWSKVDDPTVEDEPPPSAIETPPPLTEGAQTHRGREREREKKNSNPFPLFSFYFRLFFLIFILYYSISLNWLFCFNVKFVFPIPPWFSSK